MKFRYIILYCLVLVSLTLVNSCSLNVLRKGKSFSIEESICFLTIFDLNTQQTLNHGSGWLGKNAQGYVRIFTTYSLVESATLENVILLISFWNDDLKEMELKYTGSVSEGDNRSNVAAISITAAFEQQYDQLTAHPISQEEINTRYHKRSLAIAYAKQLSEKEQVYVTGIAQKETPGSFVNYLAEASGIDENGFVILSPIVRLDFGVSGGPVFDRRLKRVVAISWSYEEADGKTITVALPVMKFNE